MCNYFTPIFIKETRWKDTDAEITETAAIVDVNDDKVILELNLHTAKHLSMLIHEAGILGIDDLIVESINVAVGYVKAKN